METVRSFFQKSKRWRLEKYSFDAVLGEKEILCAAICSLISTGTELQCLRGVFDPDTNWSSWVQYPFHPGYSMVAEMTEVGAAVRNFKKGDRLFVENPHTQFFKTQAVNGPAGYIVCYEIASHNLRLGLDVIADTVNPIHETRRAWQRRCGVSRNSVGGNRSGLLG